MPSPIDREELLARFLNSEKKYTKKTKKVKHQALYPSFNQARSRFETSVERISSVSQDRLVKRGREVVIPKPLIGWAQFPVSSVLQVDLGVEPDPPPDTHAEIVHWPELHHPGDKEVWKDALRPIIAASELTLLEA